MRTVPLETKFNTRELLAEKKSVARSAFYDFELKNNFDVNVKLVLTSVLVEFRATALPFISRA